MSRIADGVVHGEIFGGPVTDCRECVSHPGEAAHIDRRKVNAGIAVDNPIRERFTCTATTSDTHRIHAAAHEEAGHFGCFAH